MPSTQLSLNDIFQKSGCTSSASVSTNSSGRTLTRGDHPASGCNDSRSDPELSDEQLPQNRVKRSAVRSKKDGKFKVCYRNISIVSFLAS